MSIEMIRALDELAVAHARCEEVLASCRAQNESLIQDNARLRGEIETLRQLCNQPAKTWAQSETEAAGG